MEKVIKTHRAVVLGGGGQVGKAWLSGLLSKLIIDGVQLNQADLIIGTSAGSQVGSQLALGILDLQNPPAPANYGTIDTSSDAFSQLYPLMAQASKSPEPETIRRKIGENALKAKTMSPEQGMQRMAFLNGHEWPDNFKATTVSVTTGAFRLWDKNSNIDLMKGVASSSALPGVFPPVTINDDTYVDGGVRSMVNADLAAGYDFVIVISCFSLKISSDNSPLDILNEEIASELETLRKSGSKVKVIAPDSEFLKLTKDGTDMLNLSLIPEAWQIGRVQAESEKKDIDKEWF